MLLSIEGFLLFFLAAMPFFPLYLTCLPIFLVCGACGVAWNFVARTGFRLHCLAATLRAPPVPAAFSFANLQAVPSHGWRLSSMQKCKALLFNKCFFGGKFPLTGSGNVVCLLPCAPLCPPLAFSVRTFPELVEVAASPSMEPKVGDEEHVRSNWPRCKMVDHFRLPSRKVPCLKMPD